MPKVKKVALAYSGGLDSSLAVTLLRRVYKPKKLSPLRGYRSGGSGNLEGDRKAKVLDIKPITVDLKRKFTQTWLTRAIHANSGLSGLSSIHLHDEADYSPKGCGDGVEHDAMPSAKVQPEKGNDQYRMHNVFKTFALDLTILVRCAISILHVWKKKNSAVTGESRNRNDRGRRR